MISRLLSGLALGAMVALPAWAQTPKDTLVVAWNLDAVSTLDPDQIGEVVTDRIMSNVCQWLVLSDMDDPSKLIPGLAESWSVSPDGLKITFKLKAGLKFPSGNPVTADDAAWSLQRAVWVNYFVASNLTEWGYTKDNVAQLIKALDDRTLEVTLPAPYPSQLILSAIFANRAASVLDRKEVEAHAVNNDYGNGWLKTHTACAGPYRVRSWTANESIVLERNDGWTGGPKPALRRVVVRHVPEAAAQRLQLEKGDIDVAKLLTSDNLDALASNPDVKIQVVPVAGYDYVTLNTTNPIFANPKVREALRYLVDYQGLGRTVMKWWGVPRAALVPLGSFGALSKEDGLPFKLDLDKARQLLAEAGYPDGFSAKMILSQVSAFDPLIAQHIQANAAKVGIKIELEQLAQATLFSRGRSRDFDMMLIGWFTNYADAHAMLSRHAYDPDPRPEAKLVGYPVWRGGWQNLDVNKQIDAAKMEQDPAKRAAMYADLQRTLMHEGPFVYLFQETEVAAVRTSVKGYKENAFRFAYDAVSKD